MSPDLAPNRRSKWNELGSLESKSSRVDAESAILEMSVDKLRQEALALPLEERAALAKDLLLSLDEPAESDGKRSPLRRGTA
jgi:hypothetical protein